MGLITLDSRKITEKGIQPTGEVQWKFHYLWLYGLVEPKTGESFFREFSHLDGICFEQYLTWFSQKYPKDLHLIQVDNSRCHTWSELELPDNIILIFQPPYSPEVNPIERFWQEIKKSLKWELFPELDSLRRRLSKILSKFNSQLISKVTGWDFILQALSVANI